MKWLTTVACLLTVVFSGLNLAGFDWALSFAITFGTFFYHFAMRLLVGHAINRVMRNRANLTSAWYQQCSFEIRLYKILDVKKWKGHMPTYAPSVFDPKLHGWEAIAQAMCQAEIVHEVITILSFLPLLAAIPFGSFGVFLITSILAAMFDLSFVIMQRYNRPRIMKLISKERAAK